MPNEKIAMPAAGFATFGLYAVALAKARRKLQPVRPTNRLKPPTCEQ